MSKLTAYEKKYVRKQFKEGDLPSITAVKQQIAVIKQWKKAKQ